MNREVCELQEAWHWLDGQCPLCLRRHDPFYRNYLVGGLAAAYSERNTPINEMTSQQLDELLKETQRRNKIIKEAYEELTKRIDSGVYPANGMDRFLSNNPADSLESELLETSVTTAALGGMNSADGVFIDTNALYGEAMAAALPVPIKVKTPPSFSPPPSPLPFPSTSQGKAAKRQSYVLHELRVWDRAIMLKRRKTNDILGVPVSDSSSEED